MPQSLVLVFLFVAVALAQQIVLTDPKCASALCFTQTLNVATINAANPSKADIRAEFLRGRPSQIANYLKGSAYDPISKV